MYGKIFDSIYDGTLRANWKALITFQQLVILAGPDGVVDMTPHAIHGRTGIPLDIIEHGLAKLAEPDPHSRSPEMEGRRIVLLDDHRPWGWRLVNHAYYRDLVNRADKREKDRIRIAEKRKNPDESDMSRTVAKNRTSSPCVADVAHASYKLHAAEQHHVAVTPQPAVAGLKKNGYPTLTAQALDVLEFLNQKTKRNFRGLDGNDKPTVNLTLVIDRLKTGITAQDCKTVIARKHRDWSGDDKMRKYLRPSTLFRASNFEQYLGECVAE